MKHLLFISIVAYYIFSMSACSPSAQHKTDEKKSATVPAVEFKAQVDKPTATVGDIITLSLTATSEPQLDVHIVEAGSQITGMRIIDTGEDGPRIIDTRKIIKKWYKLQPDIVGSYIISPLTATYKDPQGKDQEIKTSQIIIEVKSVLKDKPAGAAQDIIDIKPLQSISRPWGFIILFSTLMLLLVASGAFLYFYYRKKKKAVHETITPAHVLALEELGQLKQEQLVEKGIVQEYYFRLSEIFRRYIERRFKIPAVERTTEELLPDIVTMQEFGSAVKSETREILRSADLAKFAKFSPDSSAAENDYTKVVHIIEETKEHSVPELQKKTTVV